MKRYRLLALLIAVAALWACGLNKRVVPTHWALIVGISEVDSSGGGADGELSGVERDARAVRDALVDGSGVPEENVRMLLNQEATLTAITEAMTEWLPANVGPGDQITIYLSHRDRTVFDFSDAQMVGWLAALPTDKVVVVWDGPQGS